MATVGLRKLHRPLRRWAILAVLLAPPACAKDSPVNAGPRPAARVRVSPDSARIVVGDTVRLTPTALDAAGSEVNAGSFVWASSQPQVAQVTAGLVTGLAAGTTTISASAGIVSGSALVTVLPAPHASVTVAPSDWALELSSSAHFSATVSGPSDTRVSWRVDGIPGGSPARGTIDADGVYHSPSAMPAGGIVTVSAVSRADSAAFASVPVRLLPASSGPVDIVLEDWQPRVATPGSPDSIRLTVSTSGNADQLVLTRADGSSVLLQPLRTNTWTVAWRQADLLVGYPSTDLHHLVGYLQGSRRGSPSNRYNLLANVRDPVMPDVAVVPLAPDAQASTHLLNLRYDSLYLGGTVPPAVVRRFYDLLPDQFDFLAVVEAVNSPHNRFFLGVRNDVRGLGLAIYDASALYGGPAHLRGIVHFPISDYFDLGDRSAVHELGHNWMNYVGGPLGGGGHWPISDVAYGIIGYALAGGEGGDFPYHLVPDGGAYRLDYVGPAGQYNDVELYLMGLIPPDSVGPHFVFKDQVAAQALLAAGGPLTGAVTPITIDTIMASVGPRTPPAGQAPRSFRIGTIVLSRGRLLSPVEMAFFDHLAARGAATTPLWSRAGMVRVTSQPFYLATAGRATLDTRVH